MTGPQAVACLTTGATAGVLLLGLGTLRAALRARRQEPLVAPVNRDVTAQERRPAPPPPENPMRDTLIVAVPLGWDAQPRKEYEL